MKNAKISDFDKHLECAAPNAGLNIQHYPSQNWTNSVQLFRCPLSERLPAELFIAQAPSKENNHCHNAHFNFANIQVRGRGEGGEGHLAPPLSLFI